MGARSRTQDLKAPPGIVGGAFCCLALLPYCEFTTRASMPPHFATNVAPQM